MDTADKAHPMGSPLLDGSNSEHFSSPRRHIDINNHESRPVDPLNAVLKSRQRSIDVFRGLTMLGMILVDNQGMFNTVVFNPQTFTFDNYEFVYEQFSEDLWNGIRLCNFIFPWFLFIMGISTALSNDKFVRPRKAEAGVVEEEGPVPISRAVWLHLFKRFILLFVIGFAFNVWGNNFHDHFRVMGVLQRIALCYLLSTLLFVLITNPWVQRFIVFGVFSATYLGVMYGFDVPNGCGRGNLTLECNAAGWIDRQIFTRNYMYHVHNPITGELIDSTDPEGIFSTLTALITTWCGVECGRHLQNQKQILKHIFDGASDDHWGKNKVLLGGWFGFGSALLVVGGVMSIWVPFNKQFWSLSFALVTAGAGCIALTLLYAVIDIPWPICAGCTHADSGTESRRPLSAKHGKRAGGGGDDSYGTVRLSPPELTHYAKKGCCDDIECRGVTFWNASLQPWLWLGMNPIAVFIGMVALEIILIDSAPKVDCHGCDRWIEANYPGLSSQSMTVWNWLYWKGTATWTDDRKGASMFVATVHVLLWTLVSGAMYAKRIFLKL